MFHLLHVKADSDEVSLRDYDRKTSLVHAETLLQIAHHTSPPVLAQHSVWKTHQRQTASEMPASRLHDLPESLVGVLLILRVCAIFFGLWFIGAMFVVNLWAMILAPFMMPLIQSVFSLAMNHFPFLIRAVYSLAMNHFPWFVVLVLTAYIITTRGSIPAKQEPPHKNPPKHEPQHKTLDEIMVELQRTEWDEFVRESRQALGFSGSKVITPKAKERLARTLIEYRY
jgi:hypothetical protein